MWRVIYLVPGVIGVIEIILIALIFRLEPIAYCIMMGYEKQGYAHMKKVYRKKDPSIPESLEDLLQAQYSYMKRSTTMDAASCSFKEAVCGNKYGRGSWTCFILNCFN